MDVFLPKAAVFVRVRPLRCVRIPISLVAILAIIVGSQSGKRSVVVEYLSSDESQSKLLVLPSHCGDFIATENKREELISEINWHIPSFVTS